MTDDMIPRTEADALVAAAYADAAAVAQEAWYLPETDASPDPTRQAIIGLIPADAQAALDRRIAEAVEAERERVLRLILDEVKYDAYALSRSCVDAIRAGE